MPSSRQRPPTWVLLTGAAAAPVAAWWLLRAKRPAHDATTTDFDRFLLGPAPATQPALDHRQSTQFDSFLKVKAFEPDSKDFSTFLKSAVPGGSTSSSNAAAAAATAQAEEVPLDRARVAVMYGTEYGFAKEIAEKLCAQLKASDAYWPELLNMADCEDGHELAKEQVVLMVCSTQGDGVPPSEARGFCDWLAAGKAGALGHLSYSVCALGDRSYTHYCRCGKQLDAALSAAGAAAVAPVQEVNREDWAAVDGWISAVLAALPTLPLKSIAETGFGGGRGAAAAAAVPRWGKARPYPAQVVAVEGLCTAASAGDKNTVRVELDLGDSGLTYQPGDALGIYPSNEPQAVEELLAQLGASGNEQTARPSWHYTEASTPGGELPATMPLRDALARCYDLRCPRERQLLQLLWEHMPEQAQAAALQHQQQQQQVQEEASESDGDVLIQAQAGPTSKQGSHVDHMAPSDSASSLSAATRGGNSSKGLGLAGKQALRLQQLMSGTAEQLEAYLAERHVIDVLRDFSEGQLASAQELLPALRPLQPRLYSISSSPLEGSARVQATIATVRYTSLALERVGVCSTYTNERLQPGLAVPVYIHRNPDFRLPAQLQTPIIMVGPGTGLAPFRAFILQRLLEGKQQGADVGRMVLYFGCRRSDQDYLYGADLERWAAEGAITLHTAFSRQQPRCKVYVQQRLRESGADVWGLLQAGAHFYVCGDANSMAGAVEEALVEVIEQHQGQGHAAARAYLDGLSAAERYQRDVWFS